MYLGTDAAFVVVADRRRPRRVHQREGFIYLDSVHQHPVDPIEDDRRSRSNAALIVVSSPLNLISRARETVHDLHPYRYSSTCITTIK